MKTRLLPYLIVAAISLGTGARAQVRYRIYSSGVNFDPVRINGLGEIAGDDGSHSFVYGRRTGTVELHAPYSDQLYAKDIDSRGRVVGGGYLYGSKQDAFVWTQAGGIQSLGIAGSAYASGVNRAGWIVGSYYDGTSHAFLAIPGQDLQILQPLYGGFAGARRINNVGQVLGATMAPGDPNHDHACIWNPDGTTVDLGNMGPQYQNYANDINELGWVAGFTFGPWGNTGYVWSPESGFTPVFNPYDLYGYCAVNGMNDHNVAVGTMSISGQGWRGYIRAKDGTLTLLNSLLAPGSQGWVVTDCYDVNNLGQIAAVGEKNGQRYGVLLQPVPGGTLTFGGGW